MKNYLVAAGLTGTFLLAGAQAGFADSSFSGSGFQPALNTNTRLLSLSNAAWQKLSLLVDNPAKDCITLADREGPGESLSETQRQLLHYLKMVQASDDKQNDLRDAANDFFCKKARNLKGAKGILGTVEPLGQSHDLLIVGLLNKDISLPGFFHESEHLGQINRFSGMNRLFYAQDPTSMDMLLRDFMSRLLEADAVAGELERSKKLADEGGDSKAWQALLPEKSYKNFVRAYETGGRQSVFKERMKLTGQESENYRLGKIKFLLPVVEELAALEKKMAGFLADKKSIPAYKARQLIYEYGESRRYYALDFDNQVEWDDLMKMIDHPAGQYDPDYLEILRKEFALLKEGKVPHHYKKSENIKTMSLLQNSLKNIKKIRAKIDLLFKPEKSKASPLPFTPYS